MGFYVQRDRAGIIIGLYASFQEGFAEEFLEEDNPEVIAFLNLPELPVVIKLWPTDLWRRMGDAEVIAVENIMGSQTARIQRIFNAATEYRSDDELWSLLVQIATTLFGAERAAQILAPSD